jgi:hypothetical protein
MVRWIAPGAAVTLFCVAAAEGSIFQSYQQSGQIGLEVVATVGQGTPIASGTFTLLQVTGPVLKATFYASEWNNNANPIDLALNTVNLGAVNPFANDVVFGPITQSMFTYRWDVTSLVMTAGSYNYTVGGISPGGITLPALALVVVYADPSGPNRQVTILDGAQQVGESSSAMSETFTLATMQAGPTVLNILSSMDDNNNSGETVSYNGNVVGGPFDQFLGLNATLDTSTTTSVAGNNTLVINSPGDYMGIVLATAAVTLPAGPGNLGVPEAGAIVVWLMLAALALACQWRRFHGGASSDGDGRF